MADGGIENERKSEDKIAKRKRISEYLGSADFWTALATIFLVGVGIWGVAETKHALKLSERAWVSPVATVLAAQLEEGKVIRFNVVFVNFGKQPGINTIYAIQHGVTKAPPFEDWSSLTVEKNSTCDGLIPVKGAFAIVPSINGIGTFRTFDSGTGKDPITTNKAIIDGVLHYYFRGCVAYTTFDETHISSFCYVLQSRAGVEWNKLAFLPCHTGFEAD